MKRWIAILSTALLASPVCASPAQDATVEKLLVLADVQKSADAAVTQAETFIASDIMPIMNTSDLSDTHRTTIKKCIDDYRRLIRESLSWQAVKPEYVRIYKETFSEEELRELTVFYESPVGKMLVAKTPQLDEKMGKMINARIRGIMDKIQSSFTTVLK